jgi:hypothetical protein
MSRKNKFLLRGSSNPLQMEYLLDITYLGSVVVTAGGRVLD